MMQDIMIVLVNMLSSWLRLLINYRDNMNLNSDLSG